MPDSLIVAIGGNATHPENIRGTTEEQEQIAAAAARSLRPLVEAAPELVITHGNGPVVGKILLRQTYARAHIPPMRLDVCVAHTQGGIGHLLMQGLEDELSRNEVSRRVACIVTRVAVSADDPAFQHPSKPVGPFFSAEEAESLQRSLGWNMMEDAGRGWRHCVASPEPRSVLNADVIRKLLDAGMLVIAGGGGGVPVTRDGRGEWTGVQAVIDKDLTSAVLASQMEADTLLMLTSVERVAVDFRKRTQRDLETVTASELAAYQKEGQFPAGSMGPKVQAALNFVAAGGRRAIIAHLDKVGDALAGKTGTHVLPG